MHLKRTSVITAALLGLGLYLSSGTSAQPATTSLGSYLNTPTYINHVLRVDLLATGGGAQATYRGILKSVGTDFIVLTISGTDHIIPTNAIAIITLLN
jgi:hypothetical protein